MANESKLELEEIPSYLVGTKNYFTNAHLYRALSRADEVETVWSSPLEFDPLSALVLPGHDIFAMIALSSRLDQEIALDAHRARHARRK